MEIKHVKLIYFSPTGATRKLLESIAKGMMVDDVEHINLTVPEEFQQAKTIDSDEIAIIGAPVYGGRLPVDAIKRFKQIKARKTLSVPIVVYGNREFEDALLELKNLAVEVGFNPIAGGAFIGEHSYATTDVPIANGRPDSLDIENAMNFGARIRDKINDIQSPDAQIELEIPGRFPYQSSQRTIPFLPVTNEKICTHCGTCTKLCPTAAISINGNVATKNELCIRCFACIKKCPTAARVCEDSMLKKITQWLNQQCSNRKEPQLFGIDV